MTTEQALHEIEKFWQEEPLSFRRGVGADEVLRLAAEYQTPIPKPLRDYIREVAPADEIYFDTVGNPTRIYAAAGLGFRQDGYSWDSRAQKPIEGWPARVFILADEGADPVVVDLTDATAGVQKLRHGAGSWEYGETIADTIGQFLLCSAALHHALNHFEDESVVDDEKGFNLAPEAAAWYFANMKSWAGIYYDAWCSVFDNH